MSYAVSSGRQEIHRDIQQDWANREYIEVISQNIKKITDFLNSFDLSCRSKLALLNEKLTNLERKIEHLEARVARRTPGAISQAAVKREVKPVVSATSTEARKRVLTAYKKWQRYVPEFHLRYTPGRSIEEVRYAIKKQFLQNARVTDPRSIDLLVHKAEIEWFNTTMNYNQSCHIFSKLFADSVESKPKDFLGKFFSNQD